jgi:hypothetical protein
MLYSAHVPATLCVTEFPLAVREDEFFPGKLKDAKSRSVELELLVRVPTPPYAYYDWNHLSLQGKHGELLRLGCDKLR